MLKLCFSFLLAIIIYTTFFYLCWVAQSDAQGMIVFLIFAPIAAILCALAVYLINRSKVSLKLFSRALRISIWLPLSAFYFSFLGSFVSQTLAAPSVAILATVKKVGEGVTGVSPYDWGRGNRRIHMAARKGDLKLLKSEMNSGTSIELVNHVNETPIFFCIDSNQIEICRYLIQNGANINHQRLDGSTLLHLAVLKQDGTEVLDLLIKAGIKTEIENMSGKTALTWAKEKKYEKIIRFLRAKGVKE